MTTELTLREKVIDVTELYGSEWGKIDGAYIVSAIADLLSATGAPAYIRVADDLRGVVREEEETYHYFMKQKFLNQQAKDDEYISNQLAAREAKK